MGGGGVYIVGVAAGGAVARVQHPLARLGDDGKDCVGTDGDAVLARDGAAEEVEGVEERNLGSVEAVVGNL